MRPTKLVSLAALFILCACDGARETYLKVSVRSSATDFTAGAARRSTCVRVYARDTRVTEWTTPVLLDSAGAAVVAVARGSLDEAVSVGVVGYSDDLCTKPAAPPEEAPPSEVRFPSSTGWARVEVVELELARRGGGGDAGSDGGPSTGGDGGPGTAGGDAGPVPGSDGGVDAGAGGEDGGIPADGGSPSPFQPTNVTWDDVAALGPLSSLRFTCSATLDTADASVAPASCVDPPSLRSRVVLQANGGGELLLVAATSLDVPAGVTVTVTGARPLTLAVRGDAAIAGTVVTRAGTSDCRGESAFGAGGGGGLGSAGGAGGTSRAAGFGGSTYEATGGSGGAASPDGLELRPLRPGCAGGDSRFILLTCARGGRAGGALQLVADGALTVTGALAAPGGGGEGGGAGCGEGGGGGGSGGALLLEARRLVLDGARLTAQGGAGGGGGDSEAAGGGAGDAGSAGAITGPEAAVGGSPAPPNAGRGGDGASLQAPGADGADAVAAGGDGRGGGGGGGGGLGIVRLNAHERCTIERGASLGPVLSSGGAAPCP